MNSFHLRIVASNRVFYSGMCTCVVFQTVDGEIGFMAHHEESMTAISTGEIRIQKEDGTWISAVTSEGISEFANNRMRILVFSCEYPEEIDIERAREAEERAKEQMRQKQSIRAFKHSEASLARAMARLREASKNVH